MASSSTASRARRPSRWFVCLAAVASTVCLSAGLAQGQTPRQVLDEVTIESHVGQSMPLEAEFRDHLGRRIELGEVFGKRPVVLCLVYFDCPMLCKLAADGVVRAAASVPENVGQAYDVAFISFDPRDTSERADAARKQALERYDRDKSGAGWHFLTGTQENIDQLTDAVGFRYAWDEKTQQFAHAAGLTIVSPAGVITEYLNGVRFSPRELMSAVNRAANNELSQTKPTSFVRCYLYDPTTGRFGLAVQWTIRVLGGLTVAALVVGVYRLHQREQTNG